MMSINDLASTIPSGLYCVCWKLQTARIASVSLPVKPLGHPCNRREADVNLARWHHTGSFLSAFVACFIVIEEEDNLVVVLEPFVVVLNSFLGGSSSVWYGYHVPVWLGFPDRHSVHLALCNHKLLCLVRRLVTVVLHPKEGFDLTFTAELLTRCPYFRANRRSRAIEVIVA